MPRRSDDPDWVYFRGFGGTPYAVNHGPLLTVENCVETPKAPPRRKRPQQRLQDSQKPLRRSLSFTDAHYIAQAVYEGDAKLIEELYPDFPRSEPIYAVVDKSKKRQSRLLNESEPEPLPVEVPTGSGCPLPACIEVSREGSSARSCSSGAGGTTATVEKPAQRIQTEDVLASSDPRGEQREDKNDLNANPEIIDTLVNPVGSVSPVVKEVNPPIITTPANLTFQQSMFVRQAETMEPKNNSQQASGKSSKQICPLFYGILLNWKW